MHPHGHEGVHATHDGVSVVLLSGRDGVVDALDLLDRAERAAGVPLVDESERQRLNMLESGEEDRSTHWHSLLARCGDQAVGYAGVVLGTYEGIASADLAIDRAAAPTASVMHTLLLALRRVVRHHEVGRLRVWLRHAEPSDVACAANDGFSIDRRLGVLGRDLGGLPPVPANDSLTVRASHEADADGIVDVLVSAYEGTPDGGWTREEFDRRRGLPWFRAEDLLVAEDASGDVVGVHWTKRRGNGVGEVYNLAVSPEIHGRGIGATLLVAGLHHLRDVGCDRVLLWVDLSNERAVRLYVTHGFTTRWEDLALGRTLAPSPAG